MKQYIPALCIALAFVAGVMLLRAVAGWMIVTTIIAAIAIFLFIFRTQVSIWARAKLAEWKSDVRAVWLWMKLAFKSKRDASATATMAHQQAFLSGRLMDPVNLIMIAVVAILALPLLGGFYEWRINRVKRERDAPCSNTELSLDRNGHYRTSREACATLGETLIVAVQWRDRATELQAQREQDLQNIDRERREAEALDRDRRARARREEGRQRRRQNEAITAALGGPAPDLERSVCELAGASDCGPSGAANVDGGAATDAVPSGSGGAANVTNP